MKLGLGLRAERVARIRDAIARLGASGILASIEAKHNVSDEEILGDSHKPHCVRPRHELWCALRVTFDLSYPRLGEIVDRDHSTVIAGVRAYRVRSARRLAGDRGKAVA